MKDFWLIFVTTSAVLILMWMSYGMGKKEVTHWVAKFAQMEKDRDEAREELRTWQEVFERQVEERAQKVIREWEPDPEDIRDDFRHAEYMAAKREQINSHRLHPPREDSGGDHAVIGKIQIHHGHRADGEGRHAK